MTIRHDHRQNRRISSTLASHVQRAQLRDLARPARPLAAVPPAPEPALVVPPAPPLLAPLEPAPEEVTRRSELEEDLRLARDLQQGLLLQAVPRLPGWEISAVSLPARDLGGDLYDFLPMGESRHGIMIGDVSGKGLPAALRMAVARTLFRQEARRGNAPGPTLGVVNQTLIEEMPHGMVTMLYATINTKTGELTFANAGHNYPLLINGGLNELEVTGIPLGVADLGEYEEMSATLEYGDTVLLYTDGIIEAENSASDIYGYERLAQLMLEQGTLKPRALMARILADVRAWGGARSQADDITMVLIRRRLSSLGEELKSITADVIGADKAEELWGIVELPPLDAPVEEWYTGLKRLGEAVQAMAGRGIARELQQQLRLVIEEYRVAATPPEGLHHTGNHGDS
jgi:sigma-B regulation protein RsbU (phosphoserine phosphatase)